MERTFSNMEPYKFEEAPGVFKRVSWGAIFAGLVVALVIELVLSLLGIGIGLGAIKPASSNSAFGGIGTGALIWLGISTLIALFAAGWVTAKLAGSVRGLTGVLNSLVMWGLVTLASFFLLTSTIGSLISGVAGVIGESVSLVAKAGSAIAPQASEKIQQTLQEKGITVDSMMNDVKQVLRETNKPELQPENLQQQVQSQWPSQSAGTGTQGAQTPQAVDQELRSKLQSMLTSGKQTLNAADKDALVNVVMARTNMTRPEAEKTVDSWVQKYQQVVQTADQAKQQALQTTESAMNTLSKIGIWMFVLMLLEAIAAAFGGWIGASREHLHPKVVNADV